MYESHHSADSILTDSLAFDDYDLPEVPEQWSLEDFADLVQLRRVAS